MFEAERGVQTALKELYLEVLLFLQRIRVTVTKNCKPRPRSKSKAPYRR